MLLLITFTTWPLTNVQNVFPPPELVIIIYHHCSCNINEIPFAVLVQSLTNEPLALNETGHAQSDLSDVQGYCVSLRDG